MRERRLDDIAALMERLIFDVARLCAGHRVALDGYLHPDLARNVRRSVQPFLMDGYRLHPDFGIHAEMRVEGDLLAPHEAVRVTVAFDDRSTSEASDGHLQAVPARRVAIEASLRIPDNMLTSLSFAIAPPRGR